MINILMVDDHAIVRAGLEQLLGDTPDLVVAGQAGSASEAFDQMRRRLWDVVVLDLSLPDCSGLEVLRRITSHFPTLPVLILSMHAEEQYAIRLLRMGALGYLTKESAPEQLVSAIRTVARGDRYVSPTLAATLAVAHDPAQLEVRHATLSHREFQVMCLLASGKTPTEVADELGVSPKTVSTHRSRTLEKMRLKNTAELMQYALRHRLAIALPEETPLGR